MERSAIRKLDRLLKKFPETWVHAVETEEVDGVPKTFHHVDYRSSLPGKPKVRLVAYVSPEMCEMLVTLKNNAPEMIEAVAEASAPAKTRAPRKSKES